MEITITKTKIQCSQRNYYITKTKIEVSVHVGPIVVGNSAGLVD